MTPEQFVERLQGAMPSGLKSVVLYGSAAAGDFVPGASDYNLLLVAESWSAAELQAIAEVVSQWQRAGNPPPQLFTSADMASSADAFPIEILDLQQSHKILWGTDLLGGIQVSPEHLRSQLEHELKSKLLRLRQRYLAACRDPQRTAGVLMGSLSTFLVLFRAALRLYDNEVPAEKRAALLALSRHVAFDPQPFLTLLDFKERHSRPPTSAESLAASYLASIEQVVTAVDRHIHEQDRRNEA